MLCTSASIGATSPLEKWLFLHVSDIGWGRHALEPPVRSASQTRAPWVAPVLAKTPWARWP